MRIIKQVKSKDGIAIKFLQQTWDKQIIETGYYNSAENIICISTQIGCPVRCIFCATNDLADKPKPHWNFIRNISCEEICQQVDNVLEVVINKNNKSKPMLISYMGMGEPFLNYENVICSIKKLSLKYPNIKQATIATSGISPEKMKELAKRKFGIKVKIHLSLHAPNEKLRKKIMPMSKSIKKAIEAMAFYSKIKKEKLKINYAPIAGLNDSDGNIKELAKLLLPYKENFILKLMVLNNFKKLKKSSEERFNQFEKILKNTGIEVVRFLGDGLDIKAGCGQLRRHYYK